MGFNLSHSPAEGHPQPPDAHVQDFIETEVHPRDHEPQHAVPGSAPTTPASMDNSLEAWLVALGSMIIMLQTWGIANSFGVFQTFYETEFIPSSSSSDIAWIGSLQGSLLLCVSIVSGPLFDAGFFRQLLWTGSFLIHLSLFMTSLCTTYWQLILAQGVCFGVGSGLALPPAAAVLSQWFLKRRAFALGFLSIGSPIATLTVPILFSRLRPVVGFPWAVRIIAFTMLTLSAIPLALMKTRRHTSIATASESDPMTSKKGLVVRDPTVLRDAPFLAYVAAQFFTYLSLYVVFNYIQLYAVDTGLATYEFSVYFVTFLGVGNLCGRLLANFTADYVGSLEALAVAVLFSSVMAFSWMGVTSSTALIPFVIIFGAFAGAVASLGPSALVPLCHDMSRLGARMGVSWFCTGISVLIGTPIAGQIRSHDGDWTGVISYTGAMLLIGFVLTATSLFLHRRQKKQGSF